MSAFSVGIFSRHKHFDKQRQAEKHVLSCSRLTHNADLWVIRRWQALLIFGVVVADKQSRGRAVCGSAFEYLTRNRSNCLKREACPAFVQTCRERAGAACYLRTMEETRAEGISTQAVNTVNTSRCMRARPDMFGQERCASASRSAGRANAHVAFGPERAAGIHG